MKAELKRCRHCGTMKNIAIDRAMCARCEKEWNMKRSKAGREKYGGTPMPGTSSSLPADKLKRQTLKDLDYIINDVDDLSESLRHLRDRIEGLK